MQHGEQGAVDARASLESSRHRLHRHRRCPRRHRRLPRQADPPLIQGCLGTGGDRRSGAGRAQVGEQVGDQGPAPSHTGPHCGGHRRGRPPGPASPRLHGRPHRGALLGWPGPGLVVASRCSPGAQAPAVDSARRRSDALRGRHRSARRGLGHQGRRSPQAMIG